MFNSGIRGKRASDNTGTVSSQTQFVQQKYPQPSITGYSIQGTDDTALNPAGGQTVLVNGTGFASGLAVTVNGVTISPVTVLSPTQISFTSTALAGGSYTLIVYNSTGGAAILVPGLIYSAVPTWTTAAGSIGSYYETTAINSNVVATSDSAITYSLASGSLPSGATLYGNGVITGTSPVESGSSTYTFGITATDAELQDTTRTFTLTINTDVVTWSSPANNTTYTINQDAVAANVTLSASSAAGYAITYAANALPTGLSLTGNTISGTPTVVANSSTLLTATAATSNRNATRTINWVVQLGTDPYFNLTTLLLNGETSSSYWIQDSSTNNFALTVNGDTRPVAFSPYKTVWSNYFDGTSDYFTVPDNANLQLGSGNFTAEGWFNSLSTKTGAVVCFYSKGVNTSGGIIFGVSSDYVFCRHSGTTDLQYNSGTGTNSNQWVHVAWVRNGSTLTIYRNGVSVASSSVSINQNDTSIVYFGSIASVGDAVNRFGGYISNFRLVKGTAVYTGNFTPPTSPLTAIANTSLLVCQSNRLIDNSTNNFTITKNGNVSVTNFGPFVETDLTTGSGYFDGTGDYLTIPANAAFNFGTGDFTIECFYYRSGIKGNSFHDNIIGNRPASLTSGQWHLYVGPTAGGAFSFTARTPAGDITVTGGACIENAWNYLTVVRNGTSLSLFVNGISVNSITTTTSIGDSISNLGIGAFNDGAYPTIGFISNVRIVKGTAVYTGNFTPPTSQLTAISNTSLLTLQSRIGENNNRFVDTSGFNYFITRNYNATQGTYSPHSQTGWSYYFDGTGDSFGFSGSSINFPSSTAFTVECWVYKTARDASGYSVVIDGPENNQFAYDSTTEGSVSLVIAGTGVIGASGTAVQTNAWNHIAWVRQGTNTCRIYVNGVQQGTGTSTSGFNISTVGSYTQGGYEINGYLSNLRILVGTCLYNNGTTFTPPTSPLTAIANTQLLTCQSNSFVDNSRNNYVIGKSGDLSVQAFSPFAPAINTPTSYSAYFDGTGDYLTLPSSSAFSFGTGDFTVEGWYYLSAGVTRFCLYDSGGGGTNGQLGIFQDSASVFYVRMSTDITASPPGTNQWTHFAVTRSGTTVRLFFDGSLAASGTQSTNITNTTPYIGYLNGFASYIMNGYISNLRVVKGTAVYTSGFTPPTSPLTAIANTSVLMLQSNTFIDNSTNNFTITVSGDTKPRSFNPFGTTSVTAQNAAYSLANIGGSAYLDGSNDYLTLPTSINSKIGAIAGKKLTFEFWMNTTAIAAVTAYNMSFIGNFVSAVANGRWGITLAGSSTISPQNVSFGWTTSGSTTASVTTSASLNQNSWNHVVITIDATTASSTTIVIYLNGVGQTFTGQNLSSQTSDPGYEFWLGDNRDGNQGYRGYIGGFKISSGITRSSNFAPPTTPFTSDGNTILLLNFTSAGIIDYTSKNFLETVGNTQLSTTVKKFGSASLYFDGTGDYLTIPYSQNFVFGSGNWTIELWVYLNSSARQGFAALGDGAGSLVPWEIGVNGKFRLLVQTSGGQIIIDGTTTPSTGTWYHVAGVRNGGTATLYVNGISEASSSSLSTNSLIAHTNAIQVGRYSYGFELSGYIDDLRITKGYARYTGNFTPPTQAFITY